MRAICRGKADQPSACKSCRNRVNFAMTFCLRIALLCCAVALGVGPGCRGAAPSHGPYREFAFSVDSARLGAEAAVEKVSLRVPLGWTAADSSVLQSVRQAVRLDTGDFPVEPRAVFVGAGASVLLATTFRTKPEAAEGFTGWARRYVEAYRAARPSLDVQEEWLLLGGIHAVQLLAMDTLRVQFKFLIESEPVVGLDYSVPRAAWEQEVRAVESSLGTIRKR